MLKKSESEQFYRCFNTDKSRWKNHMCYLGTFWHHLCHVIVLRYQTGKLIIFHWYIIPVIYSIQIHLFFDSFWKFPRAIFPFKIGRTTEIKELNLILWLLILLVCYVLRLAFPSVCIDHVYCNASQASSRTGASRHEEDSQSKITRTIKQQPLGSIYSVGPQHISDLHLSINQVGLWDP